MSKFQIGEIAILTKASNYIKEVYIGMEVEILSDRYTRKSGEDYGYKVDVGIPAKRYGYSRWFCEEKYLKKRPPHSEPSTWEKCIFKPEGVIA